MKPHHVSHSVSFAACAALLLLMLQACNQVAAKQSPVERGQYLVTTMMCNDCHTPWTMGPQGPAPDMKRMLQGHPAEVKLSAPPAGNKDWPVAFAGTNTAYAGPWGVSYSANLTPDRETGTGAWTADDFIAALRTGRHQGRGRPILPPMPYPFISKLTDDDLRAIFAYLQSIPAIANKVPEPQAPKGS